MNNDLPLIKLFAVFLVIFTAGTAPSFVRPAAAQSSSYETVVRQNLELRKEIGKLKDEYAGMLNERDLLLEHVKGAQQQQQRLEVKIKALQNELANPSELKRRADEQRAEAEKLRQEKEELKQALARQDEQLKQQQADLQALRNAPRGQTDRESARNLRALEEENQRLTRHIASIKESWDKSNVELGKKHDAQLKAMQEQVAAAEGEKARAGQEMAALRADLEGRLTAEQQNARDLSGEITRLKTALAKEKEQAAGEVAAEKTRQEKLREKLDTAEGRYDQRYAKAEAKFQETMDRERAEADKVREKRDEYAAQAKDLQRQLKALARDKKKVEKQAKKAQREKERLEAKLSKLEKEMDEGLLAQKDKDRQIKSLQAENFAANVKVAKYAKRDREQQVRQEARERGEDSRVLKKKKLDIHYNLALAYDQIGMYKEEEKEYLKCLEMDPDDPNVIYNIAILYDDKLNDNKKAIDYYRRYLAVRPKGKDTIDVREWMVLAEEEMRMGEELR